MATRIEIELTSRRDDDTFTWRAAGAREPKGVADAALFPAGSSVGEQFKVDADVDLEGITVTNVLPKEGKKPAAFDTLELIARDDEPLVTQQLAEKRGGRRERGERSDRDGRGGRDKRRDRPRGDGERGPGDRGPGERGPGERGPGERGERPRGEGPRGEGPRGGERRPRSDERPRPPAKPKLPPKPKPPRLRAARAHRDELLASLPEEQKPVAQELLRGGLQAVRTALAKQNEQHRTEGAPEIDEGPILALAEDLLGRVRAAEWRDRAEAALEQSDVVDVRDLRTVVTAADGMGRDEDTRALGAKLRTALNERLDAEHNGWVTEIIELLDDDRVVRALHLSSRPPKAGAPLPAPVAMRLVELANASMTSEITADRWVYILEALAHSPVRRQVVPASLPTNVTPELKATIARFGHQLPDIAQIFGIEPDPKAARGMERRRPRKPKAGGDKPRAGGEPRGDKPRGDKPKGGGTPRSEESKGEVAPADEASSDVTTTDATTPGATTPGATTPGATSAGDDPGPTPTGTDQPRGDAITTSGPSATTPGGMGEAPEPAEPGAPSEKPVSEPAASTDAPVVEPASGPAAPTEASASEPAAPTEASADEPVAPAPEPATPEEAPLADDASQGGDGDAGDHVEVPPTPAPATDVPSDVETDRASSAPTSDGPGAAGLDTAGDAADPTTPPTADAIDEDEPAEG